MGWGMARPNAPEAVPTRTTGPIRTTSITLAKELPRYPVESHSLPDRCASVHASRNPRSFVDFGCCNDQN